MPRGNHANSQTTKATLGLRELLLDGVFKPRERVPELRLVEELGVSRTPLRIALMTLEHEGLLETLPGGGFVVREFTRTDIDAVILSTVTYFEQTPAGAAVLADRLGSTPAAAYDISAACAGYCYGIATASDMVKGGSADYVLVVGVEKLTDFTDPYDRGTAFIFGDGAGAAVVGPSDTPGIGPTVWGSDGAQRDVISNRHSWLEVRGRLGSSREVRVRGAMDRPSVAAGAVAALAAHELVAGRLHLPGAGGLGRVDDPRPLLRVLHERGVRAAVFEGAASSDLS